MLGHILNPLPVVINITLSSSHAAPIIFDHKLLRRRSMLHVVGGARPPEAVSSVSGRKGVIIFRWVQVIACFFIFIFFKG